VQTGSHTSGRAGAWARRPGNGALSVARRDYTGSLRLVALSLAVLAAERVVDSPAQLSALIRLVGVLTPGGAEREDRSERGAPNQIPHRFDVSMGRRRRKDRSRATRGAQAE
jgi:hypothetical protein